jgi:DNA-binding CsgD family transcriptional regulator
MYLNQINREIIQLTADGMSLKEIAAVTRMDYTTISTYRTRIIQMFGARNSANLVAICYNHGILKVPSQWIPENIVYR